MKRFVLEIAASSMASALAAEKGGADRIELCADLEHGGTTPSYGTIAMTRDRVRIPLYVLIRPRVGDFCYDADEISVMRRDVETCVKAGCDGVVIGALDVNADVDEATCRELIAAAGPLGVAFHRAFDLARDPDGALDTIISLRCERILTSGCEPSALDGAERIRDFVKQAAGRLAIMAGSGITAANIGDVAQRSGAREFHGSARAMRRSASRASLPSLEPDWWQSDANAVRAMVQTLSVSGT